jgi:hypothetical protein
MTERIAMSRILRPGERQDRSFDLAFWSQQSGEARMAAAWDCVLDLVRLGKLDESRLRLRRDVARVERRRG